METPAARPRSVVVAEWAIFVPALASLAALALRTAARARGPEALAALGAVPFGVAIADLASGIVHWGCDTFLREDTPLVGRLVIATFREHHRDPRAITRHGFVERNAISGIAALPVLALGLLPSTSIAGASAALACAAAVLMTNEVHAWAHAERVPRVARWLQRHGIILSPERHAMHHSAGVAEYSITTGWTSALLDRVLAALRAPRGAE